MRDAIIALRRCVGPLANAFVSAVIQAAAVSHTAPQKSNFAIPTRARASSLDRQGRLEFAYKTAVRRRLARDYAASARRNRILPDARLMVTLALPCRTVAADAHVRSPLPATRVNPNAEVEHADRVRY